MKQAGRLRAPLVTVTLWQLHVCWDAHGGSPDAFCQHLQPTLSMHQPVFVRVQAVHSDGNMPHPLAPPSSPALLTTATRTHHSLANSKTSAKKVLLPACFLQVESWSFSSPLRFLRATRSRRPATARPHQDGHWRSRGSGRAPTPEGDFLGPPLFPVRWS